MYDHSYTSADGRPQSKLFFVLWSPPDAPSISKMKYSSHKSAAVKGLPGVLDVRATNTEEITVAFGITKDAAEEEWDPGEHFITLN